MDHIFNAFNYPIKLGLKSIEIFHAFNGGVRIIDFFWGPFFVFVFLSFQLERVFPRNGSCAVRMDLALRG